MPQTPALLSSQHISLQVGDQTLHTQSIVPAPVTLEFPVITTDAPIPSIKHGENIFVLIPTANQFKTNAIRNKVEDLVGSERKAQLVIHQHNVPSGVGNQPYDENGVKGAYARIRNALAWLEQNKEVLEEKKIGTVVCAAIENYIQRSVDGTSAVDYGIIVMYNATTQTVAGTVSRGVTVPQHFLEEAEAGGFDDNARKSGKVTVGEVLARSFGIDAANWHKAVCSVSRYELLEEALNILEMSL